MIHLKTLGQAGLEDPLNPGALQLLGKSKPFALLCYLALASRPRFHRRDTLIALFWPDLDHEHSRASLRQTLRVIRGCLGADTIVNRGDEEIGLDVDSVHCDAIDFEGLCEAGEAERAMLLYAGDLLEGFHVVGAAPELAQWLDDERLRLRRRAGEMARRCAGHHLDQGDILDATRWARRALDLNPLDEPALRYLVQLLDRTGDRAGAIREYEIFAARLTQELEVGPATETRALIAAIRSRSVRARTPSASLPAAANEAKPPAPLLPAEAPPALRNRRWLIAGGIAVLSALIAFEAFSKPPAAAAVQPNLVAVMPWRVSGADSGLAYLREGMLDLLDATLTGERGLRSADPRTVLRAWHAVAPGVVAEVPLETALQVARRIGAGRVIQGAVVGNAEHLTLAVTEYLVARPGAPLVVSVTGTLDSLPRMIDHLSAELLAREAGVPGQLQGLTTWSLPVLRSYLEGRAAYRRGLYGEAAHDFDQALSLDSNFTLAALALAAGGLTQSNGEQIERGRFVAWRDSSRLSPPDRALLRAVVGPAYPGVSDERGYLEAREQAVALAPESPEAQYWRADSYFHHGRLLQLPDWSARALRGFERAIELDSNFAAPYQHLIELRLQLGDTIGVRSLAAGYFAMDSTGEYGDFLRWRVAVGLGDSTGLAALRARFDRISIESLYRIAGQAQVEGIALADAERAVASLTRQLVGTPNAWQAADAEEALRSNEGRPAASLEAAAAMISDTRRPLADRWFRVTDAIYGDGDSVAAAQAVAQLLLLAAPRSHMDATVADTQDVAACAVALWRLHRHEVQNVAAAIHLLRHRSPSYAGGIGVWMNACATILDAQFAVETGTPDSNRTRIRLDSLVNAGSTLRSPLRVAATLVLAGLDERRGNLRGALADVQRHENEYSPRYLSSQLLEEGRLAGLLGERRVAIHALQQYLALRFDPEPALRPKVDSVRAVLSELLRQR
ncbi:MAG: bacterial transcriptional activator domain-containing protein [Gemmatimonadales bacterium]